MRPVVGMVIAHRFAVSFFQLLDQCQLSISNFDAYGLYAPITGYGWSRYYDDAVLTDQRGYVQDIVSGIRLGPL